jgi:uncharacterized protein
MLSRLAHRLVGALLCLLAVLAAAWAQNLVPVPTLKARVTDLTGSLSADQITSLESKLAAFEARKGSQIAVLIVATTRPETIEQYSIRVADRWKLGRKGVDDGALLLVAREDRALRIEVGYGLEGPLPDAIAKRIIDDVMVPRLKSGDFYGGIDAGVDAMIKVVDGEPLPPALEQGNARDDSRGSLILFIVAIFVVIFLAKVLRALLGRLPAAVLLGGAAGVIVWLLVSSVAAAAVAGLLAFVFTLIGGAGFGGGYGGWGGSGGFGGGFSGGGGFGGGGASGRW